jgi:hypothetical protein
MFPMMPLKYGTVISFGPDEKFIDLAIDKTVIGDEWIVPDGQEELELKVEVSRAKGDRIALCGSGGPAVLSRGVLSLFARL